MRSLMRLKKKHPELESAISHSRESIDAMVECAVLKRALGFSTTEIKTVTKSNGAEEVTRVEKEVPPDLSAAGMWLKNRCPERWRDKPEADSHKMDDVIARVIGGVDDAANR